MTSGNSSPDGDQDLQGPLRGDAEPAAIESANPIDDQDSADAGEVLAGTVTFGAKASAPNCGGLGSRESREAVAEQPFNRIGRYEIHGVLGQGGFGTVYLGRDDQLRRDVAIKVPGRVLASVQLDEFLEEARNLAQLRHPSIVTVFDVGEEDGRCYIVSDYLEGESLKDWAERRSYSWQEAVQITAKIADALAHAHARSMVHRDVKPSNIMMLVDDEPVLIDFGLAVTDARGQSEMPGTIAGTPHYMSPEQAAGKSHRVDGRTDVYSLGVVLYRLLCRKIPFTSSGTVELLRQIIDDEPQPLRQLRPELPEAIEQACLKAMAKSQKDRYTTAADFAAELRRVLTTIGDDVSATGAVGRSKTTPDTKESLSEKESSQRSSVTSEYGIYEAQRRQITALHLDLDEADDDGEEVDPEELHAVIQRVREIAATSVQRFGGHMARADGESVEVYFGFPMSYEDSARRAVLAGLELARGITRLQHRHLPGRRSSLSFSIGIHTGVVVTEERAVEESSERHSIVGNVPRVASSLTAFAESGMIVITAVTHQIVGKDFECQSLGSHSAKRLGNNVELFRVAGERSTSDSADAAESRQTPFVGRDHELGLLTERWQQAKQSAGQVVLVSAEPGVGKSRLLSAFRASLDLEESIPFEARCATYHQNTAFDPVIGLVHRLMDCSPDDGDERRLGRLEELVRKFDLPLDATIPLLADLLSLPPGSQYPVVEGTPERRKQKAIETLVEIVLISSEQQPLLFTVEDLHWSDPSTLEFLGTLMEQLPGSAVLLVMTYRPEFIPAWPVRATVSQLQVSSLTTDQTTEIVSKLSDERGLPSEVVDYIARRTDGVPLFAEELTRTIVESGILQEQDGRFVLSEPLESLAIPSTLQDSLMARLDRLGGAREIAQLASVIGREFSYELLADVAPLKEQDLQRELTVLVDADLLHQRGFFPRARFTFRHALVQDAAYDSLLRTAKQEWHGLVVDRLAARFPQLAEAQPELLAHHFTAAKRTTEAIAAWLKAGLKSQERSAYLEAISHFESGLKLVESMESSSERDLAEFGYLIPFGVSLLSAQGYAAPRVGPVFERAAELGRQLGGPVEQFHITWGIWAWRIVREELELCMQLSDRAWEIVDAADDDGLRMEAHFIPQLTQFFRGNFTEAARHADAGMLLYDEERCLAHARHTGQNVGVTMQCYQALTLWHLGYPEQAVARANQMVELARSLGHPFTLAYAVHHAGWLHFHCGDADAVMKYAEEELAIAGDQKMVFWQAEGSICRGYSLFLQGRVEESREAIQAGIDILKLSGAGLSLSQCYSLIAASHLGAGRTAEALVVIDEAIAASAQNGNTFFLSETYRIRGEILAACPDPDPLNAEAAFRQSLKIATSQQARLPELRTTISLCRLWQTQSRLDEALALLVPVLDWFEEGFEFPDLIAANKLRATLETP